MTSSTVVTTHGLVKRYGSVLAVDGLDIEVPRGSVFGLLGPNGAGKTTTFGILCGWLKASGGSATVLGVEPRRLAGLRGRVAVLPQDAAFPRMLPVRDQLVHYGRLMGLGGSTARTEADRALEMVDLGSVGGMRGGELSHGMLKRVGLAQTLIGAPEVVFLDEPTAGLDPKISRKIKTIITELANRATVILSSHNLVDVQEICTHGAIIDKGRLAVAGTIDVLTRRGREVTIDIEPGADVPMDKLEEMFGAENVDKHGDRVRILFTDDDEVTEVIRKALVTLIAEKTPILGVSRGTSLEKAFLEVTGD